ncbi:MAG: hypothetical protein H6603_10190 [Flavobacteriales bacterium]|nr:hypothetical protein [Flavobacteriales bacterium]
MSYDYPASENGGTIRDVVYIDVPVTIDIDVDTSHFDHSVGNFKSNINFLQGAITGAEAAQIAAKIQSANEVADSIVQGFYGLIQSEIGQQISEMMPRVEALTVELMQHQESCVAKQEQFGTDFNRILQRYMRLFDDLDKELKSRILSLNSSASGLQSSVSQNLNRYFKSPGIVVSTVHVKERQGLTAKIVASGLKSRTVVFLSQAKKYLDRQRNLSVQLDEILEADGLDTSMRENLPIMFIQTASKESPFATSMFLNEANTGIRTELVQFQVDSLMNQQNNWKTIDDATRSRIDQYVNSGLVEYRKTQGNPQQADRVVQMIEKLWKSNTELRINY